MMQCEKAAFQCPEELAVFIKLIQDERVRSYLEIGSAHGGSLWRIAHALPEDSRIVSVDLPFKDSGGPNLQDCCAALRKTGRDVHLIVGNSVDRDVIKKVSKLSPYDLCFIDGNHTEPYVLADWANYGPMARIVAFHDISHPRLGNTKMRVQEVWDKIKNSYRYQEIKLYPKHKQENGIGVLWRS